MAELAALGIQNPDSFKTIGSMLNFAGQAQNLQRGNIDLQQNQIKLQERKGIQDLFSNPEQFYKPDGTPDYDKLIIGVTKVAPTTGPELIPKIIQGYKDSTAAQQTLNSLNGEQAVRVGNAFASIARLPPQEGFKVIDTLVGTSPNLAPLFKVGRQHLESVANDPAKYQQMAMQLGQSVQTMAEQRAMTTPQALQVNTPTENKAVNINAQAAPIGSTIPGTVAPQGVALGSLEEIITDPVGNKFVQTKDPSGKIISTRPVPGSSAPSTGGAPQGSGFTNLAPGQAQDIPILAGERAKISNAAAQVPQQRMNNRQILELATDEGFNQTGTGAQRIAKIMGAVGLPVGSDYATNVNKLGHYLALQAQSNAQAMGANTDASREVSEAASGNMTMTPAALRSIAKVNDAISVGVSKFNEGMEKAIAAAGGNVLAARDFKNAWSKSFDPDVYRYANALEAKDNAEITAILGKPQTPERARRARELAEKSMVINRLVTEGR